MRAWTAIALAGLFAGWVPAAAPPTNESPAVLKWVEQLGDERTAKGASKALRALGEAALPALHRAAVRHADADVRLRAAVTASAIEKQEYRELRKLVGHRSGVLALAVSPDGRRVVSAAEGEGPGTVRLWDLEQGKLLLGIPGHRTRTYAVAWSGDGKRIVTGCGPKLQVFDEEGERVRSINSACQYIYSIALTPKGDRAVVAGIEPTVYVYDLGTGKEVSRNKDNLGDVMGVALTPDGKHYFSGGMDGQVRLIDLASGKLVRAMNAKHNHAWAVAVSPDGKRVASAGVDGLVLLHDVATGKLLKRFAGHKGGLRGVAYSPGGDRLLSSGEDQTARLWDIDSGKTIQMLQGHEHRVMGAAFLPDGRHALTASEDGTLRLWKLRR